MSVATVSDRPDTSIEVGAHLAPRASGSRVGAMGFESFAEELAMPVWNGDVCTLWWASHTSIPRTQTSRSSPSVWIPAARASSARARPAHDTVARALSPFEKVTMARGAARQVVLPRGAPEARA